ncbi:hypothetical protein ACEN8K_35355, partial [Variovorax sp. CT11-76]
PSGACLVGSEMCKRHSFGAGEVGARLGLPELPRLPVLLHTRVGEGRPRAALEALSVAFRSVVRS